jgi:hypothetical protein
MAGCMGPSDEALQQKLLDDPRVKAAVVKAGENSLKDPAVQAKMIEVAQEKGPEYAQMAQQKMSAWASDPEVQAKAYYCAGTAGKYLGNAGEGFIDLVEQGPVGVRLLAFASGSLSCTYAVMFSLNLGSFVSNMPGFIVAIYQVIFALTTMLFEAPASLVAKIPAVTSYQDLLIAHCKFLSEVLGRGLFYIFQGSLWLAFSTWKAPLCFVTGCVVTFVGILHVIMYYGKLGTVATKMRAGYERVQARISERA